MAILSKIRERTFILIGIIGLALFAFIISDAIGSNNGGGARQDVVGEVNGEEISREEFSQQLEAYKSRSNGNTPDSQFLNAAWDGFVRKLVFKEQLELAGIVVGENDVWESIISDPGFQSNPLFQNEIGLFDEEKVKEYVANLREDALDAPNGSDEKKMWSSWLSYEGRVQQGVVQAAYTNLVNAGLGATLEEGKRDYLFNNTKISSKYVYLPYAMVADSLITITNSDYQNYINEHKNEFQVKEARNIKYVRFNFAATDQDKEDIKNELAALKDDFKKASNNVEFVNDEKSDLAINEDFIKKSNLLKSVSDTIINGAVGDVVGPYIEKGYYTLSKIEAFKQIPDSVSASHILLSFQGARSQGPGTNFSEVEARIFADSLLTVLKKTPSKFESFAKEYSVDKSNNEDGGKLDWYGYNTMTPEFRDYTFLNSKGDIGIVRTPFGIHIVKITGQKNFEKAVQLTSVTRKILASEATESQVFQDAEVFASKIADGNFDDLVVESGYLQSPANGIKVLDDVVPGLQGNNRNIVRWAFEEDVDVNDVKRFDIDNGYVVVMLTSKISEGLATVNNVASKIKPILIRKKKAAILIKKMSGASIEDVAKETHVTVKTASNVTLASPTISGVGNEPAIVGAMSTAKEGEVVIGLEGIKGVFAIEVTSKELPADLENYDVFRNRLAAKYKGRSAQLYTALKDATEIVDYRANIY